jgi:hypothetical protein
VEKLTASPEELLPMIHSPRPDVDPHTDGMVHSLQQFVCVYHRTRERPYQPSQRRTLGRLVGLALNMVMCLKKKALVMLKTDVVCLADGDDGRVRPREAN